jgi:hypothetical protein
MERVAFLVESTGERIGCLLNPSTVLVRRSAGVRTVRSLAGAASAATSAEDSLIYVGGGTTELTLELLFDVSVAGSSQRVADVRELTRPLSQLAERFDVASGHRTPPVVRFVWGKAWNVPGVVTTLAERLEHFTAGGVPRRAWLSLRLLRVSEVVAAARSAPTLPSDAGPVAYDVRGSGGREGDSAGGGGIESERLDQLAHRFYGDASQWRVIAEENGVDDPFSVTGGTVLRIPTRRR